MSKLKDKLSANMRTVKADQEQAAPEPAKAASEKPVAKPAAKPAAAGKPAKDTSAGAKTVPGDVQPSGTALFPARVWPD